ncbi:MAG: Ig-like domain-containing protein [Hyphomicrobiaceae bacterium]
MAEIIGTAGNDVTVGTVDADIMRGGLGNDRYNGNAGNDVIYGEEGNDTLTGDAGNDTLYGGVGTDGFFGGGGDDSMYGEAGVDTMFGDSGNDVMDGGADNDSLNGGTGNDTLIHRVGEGTDTMAGGGGVDKVVIKLSTADLTAAVRADLATLDSWLASQISSAGGNLTTLAAQTTGPAVTLAALGMTLSTFEQVSYELDGRDVPLTALLNSAPVTDANAALVTSEDQAMSGRVLATDTEGDALTYSVQQGTTHGALTLDAATGAYTYTPNANYSGADAFSVLVNDGHGGTVVQQVAVAVDGVADAPTLAVVTPVIVPMTQVIQGLPTDDSLEGTAGNDLISGGNGNDTLDGTGTTAITVPLDIAAALADLDGSEVLSIRVGGIPTGGHLSAGHDNGDGTWTLTPHQLAGLQLSASVTQGFTISVAATATEANGSAASFTSDIEIRIGEDSNVISGGAGNDTINGGTGDDLIFGGTPSSGTSTSPHVSTVADNDLVHAGDGNDIVYGNSGDDQLWGDSGNDTLHGGKGNDMLSGGDGNDVLNGNSGNDVIHDGTGDDVVNGSSGDDTIIAGVGNDAYTGGSGFDTLDFSGAQGAMVIDVSKKTASGMGQDTFSGIESMLGSAHNDTYKGSSQADVFDAGAGKDSIRSLGGADILTGGAGDDTFAYFKKDVSDGVSHFGVDHITDFSAGDRLDLRDFLKSAKPGTLGDYVRATETTDGTLVAVKMGAAFVDVVMLDSAHGHTAADMLSNGMILA